MTTLELETLTKIFPRAGTVVDAIDLRIERGEFFTFLGPSGCGKSTVLRMIAGLEEPTRGRIRFNDRDVTYHPASKRGVGLVFQNYALFPHMSVAENVAFGLEVRKLPTAEVNKRVAAALEQVQLPTLGSARVDQLSGGQQQRVALARALVISPEVLLLDEPLSNLDAKLREETRAALRRLHTASGVTTVNVTHDQTEAMGMSDRIAILHSGKIQQVATPEEIYERPTNRLVAEFIGHNNVLDATVTTVSERSVVVRFADASMLPVEISRRASGVELLPGVRVGVCIRADALKPARENWTFRGLVSDVEYGGSACACVVKTGVGELRVDIPSSLDRPRKKDLLQLSVVSTGIHLVGSA